MNKKKIRPGTIEFLDRLPDDAKSQVIKREIVVAKRHSNKSKTNQFKKQVFLDYYDGYDFLENMIAIRPYIQKKYDIDLALLEILLYLFPKNYFTSKDYQMLVRPYHLTKPKTLLDKKMIVISVPGENKAANIYKLSQLGLNIVTNFYELLAGVKMVPEHKNVLARRNGTGADAKQMELIRALKNQPVPKTRKVFFPKSNPGDTC